jgi:hypothetical protein
MLMDGQGLLNEHQVFTWRSNPTRQTTTFSNYHSIGMYLIENKLKINNY